MAYKVKVDEEKCTACGTCASIAPNTFELKDDGKAQVKKQNGEDDDTLLQAAQSCPSEAISVEDESGKKIFPEE